MFTGLQKVLLFAQSHQITRNDGVQRVGYGNIENRVS